MGTARPKKLGYLSVISFCALHNMPIKVAKWSTWWQEYTCVYVSFGFESEAAQIPRLHVEVESHVATAHKCQLHPLADDQ